MPSFAYKAKGADGNVLQGVIEADAERAAADKLRAQKLVVLEISKKEGGLGGLLGFFKGKGKVTSKDLVLFSRQLSTLVSAGVPIVQGLGILESQAENPAFKEVLGGVKADIE